MTDTAASDLPPLPLRPATLLSVEAPSTLHGMSRAERDAVESALRRQVPLILEHAGSVELVNSLMRLHDELACYTQWDRVRVGLTPDGEVLVSVRWPGEDNPDPHGCWLEMDVGTMADWLTDQATLEGADIDPDLAEDLLSRAQEMFSLSEHGRRILGSLQSTLGLKGLTRAQLARPAAFVFPKQAPAIAGYEEIFDAHARAAGLDDALPRPSSPTAKARM